MLKESFPLEIIYRITGRCNLSCEYCIYPIITKELSTEQSKRAIKEFADAGTLNWTFTGGEPLVRQDIGELINYAKDCGIPFVHLLTNGILLKYRIHEIKQLDAITFSLDGPEEIHDKLRGRGTFQKVIEAIRIVKSQGINFSITTVVTKLNMANDFYGVRYIFNLAKELGCRINFQPVYILNNRGGDFYPSKEEYELMMTFLKKLARNSNFIKYSEEAYDNVIKAIKNEKIELVCLAGKKFALLNFDGRVAPGGGFMYEAIDGTKSGFVNAFYRLNHKHTTYCFSYCYPEKDIMYKLNFNSLLRYLQIMLKYRVLF